jgi:hypothetical protein
MRDFRYVHEFVTAFPIEDRIGPSASVKVNPRLTCISDFATSTRAPRHDMRHSTDPLFKMYTHVTKSDNFSPPAALIGISTQAYMQLEYDPPTPLGAK